MKSTRVNHTIRLHIYWFRHQLQGPLNFETIGLYPAQTFFNVDRLTGSVFAQRSLKEDGVGRDQYILRVITYDSADPTLRDTADVAISVTRNPSVPRWSESVYRRTVNEEYSMGVPVLTVLATDTDGVCYNSLAERQLKYFDTTCHIELSFEKTRVLTDFLLIKEILRADGSWS